MLCQMWKGIWWQFCGCDQNKSLPVCEKEPISDYPCVTIYHRRGAGKKISSTLANLLPSHNSSYYVDDIDIGVKYRPIDWNCWETTFNWEICRFYRTSSFWLNLNGYCDNFVESVCDDCDLKKKLCVECDNFVEPVCW